MRNQGSSASGNRDRVDRIRRCWVRGIQVIGNDVYLSGATTSGTNAGHDFPLSANAKACTTPYRLDDNQSAGFSFGGGLVNIPITAFASELDMSQGAAASELHLLDLARRYRHGRYRRRHCSRFERQPGGGGSHLVHGYPDHAERVPVRESGQQEQLDQRVPDGARSDRGHLSDPFPTPTATATATGGTPTPSATATGTATATSTIGGSATATKTATATATATKTATATATATSTSGTPTATATATKTATATATATSTSGTPTATATATKTARRPQPRPRRQLRPRLRPAALRRRLRPRPRPLRRPQRRLRLQLRPRLRPAALRRRLRPRPGPRRPPRPRPLLPLRLQRQHLWARCRSNRRP